MKTFASFILLLLAGTLEAQAPIRVMSFNIRYGTANDGAHVWPNRRAHVATVIRDHAPHLLGVQEALRFQLDEIAKALPTYQEFGVGRDDGRTKGEYSAILVDTARFAVLDNGTFWFSDTPETPGSMHWGNRITRICTWVLLADKATGDTIRYFNQHWDHESQPSREKAAAMLLDRIRTIAKPNELLLVSGDFNSGEQNPAFRTLIAGAAQLRDTYRAINPNARVTGTFNAFKGDSTGDKIDAILAGPRWEVIDAQIDRRRFGALWPSDHFPVTAVLRASAGRN